MSDETATNTTPEIPPPAAISGASAILADVSTRVKDAKGEVQERLVKALVEKELELRVGLLDKAVQKRQELYVALRKLEKPDVEYFTADGTPVGQGSYSKNRLNELKTAREALEKQDKVIGAALEKDDWSRLKDAK